MVIGVFSLAKIVILGVKQSTKPICNVIQKWCTFLSNTNSTNLSKISPSKMVIGVFPLAKIVILGVKQITKPICNIVKVFAKNNRLFKTCLCAPAGQLIYWIEARSKLQMLRLPQPKKIRPLTEERATESGANLISEVLVVGIGLGLIYFEKSRQAFKDKKKHDDHVSERTELFDKVSTLSHLLDWEENELRIMNQYFSEYFTNFDK